MSVRVGHVWRDKDHSGVSGTGRVAEWIEFSDGTVVVHWISAQPSTNVYHNMKQAESVHGHNGSTRYVEAWVEENQDTQKG